MLFRRVIVGCLIGALICGCDRIGDRQAAQVSHAEQDHQKVEQLGTDLIKTASQAIVRKDLVAAEAAIRQHLLRSPDDVRALEVAGEIAALRGDRSVASEMYRAAFGQTSVLNQPLLDKLTQQDIRSGRPFDAIDVLQQAIERYPSEPQPRFDLAGLATLVGLTSAAIPSLRWLARHGQGDPESLLVLADPGRVEPDAEICRQLLETSPNELRLEYCLAKVDAIKMDWRSVVQRLDPVRKQHSDFLPAQLLFGRALVELNEFEKIPAWQLGLPEGVDSSPEYWLVAGAWAQHQGNHREAARAFLEALRLDEISYPEAYSGLFLNLQRSGREGDAGIVAEFITRQSGMRDALKTHLEREGLSQRAAMRVAAAMLELGRIWESEGWARLAVGLPNERLPDIRERYMAIRSNLAVTTPWLLPEISIAERIDLDDFPVVGWTSGRSVPTSSPQSESRRIHLEDQASQRGWMHTCEIAPEAVREGHWIFQSVGGGVGVIDFDLDGWPDLAAAMLDGKPLASDSSSNRLSRNLSGMFADVSSAAGYVDTGFSHGIAVGDFNEDGFPDLFDANFGRNRLFRNNGDGTFEDVSIEAGLSGEVWTTSAVIADIDGDGLADLFETNYCSGREPLERPCRNSGGISTCPPLDFEAELDRVWKGVGDGTFVEVTGRWLNQTSPGRGLGIVAGLFDERPGLDLYIANDMTVNHLWSAGPSGSADPAGEEFRLTELASIRGLGASGRALSQASMGIAAADADDDGDIDFFLTHFADDHNTYYEQVGSGLWVDRSYQVGLAEPSMKLLGFGTEWVDFDNNGSLELIVANGHVDDVGRSDVSYYMPAQVFQRGSAGRWEELNRLDLGNYFATDHLGRALATLDADRDGRIDVAITHLYDPCALLINRTEGSGAFIGLELKSTRGQRDAIGAIVTSAVGSRTVTSQLTAGDGYMCANQRRISIGLGTANRVDNVVVTWPSGVVQKFGDLEGGRDYLLVEGYDEAFSLPSAR